MSSAYQIGQYRFSGVDSCIENIGCSVDYVNTSMGESQASTFKDVVIIPIDNFIQGQAYYFKIQIPKDMNYDLVFSLKLTKVENNTTEVYQFLKRLAINRGGSGANVYNVALYEDLYGVVRAMIPLAYNSASTGQANMIYYDSKTDLYYLWDSNRYVRTTKVNDVSVIASWKDATSETEYGYFELIFTPVEDSFNKILLQMERSAEDYNIQRSDGTYGRVVDISKIKIQCCLLKDLVKKINPPTGSLSRVGVQSHPGLMMAINGEEIKIGQSGYYELDTINTDSFGVVTLSEDDYFILDYQYIEAEIE